MKIEYALERDLSIKLFNLYFFLSGIRKCVAARMAIVQVKYLLAKIVMRYEVIKTKKTKIEYMKNPMALTYSELFLGFRKRTNGN